MGAWATYVQSRWLEGIMMTVTLSLEKQTAGPTFVYFCHSALYKCSSWDDDKDLQTNNHHGADSVRKCNGRIMAYVVERWEKISPQTFCSTVSYPHRVRRRALKYRLVLGAWASTNPFLLYCYVCTWFMTYKKSLLCRPTGISPGISGGETPNRQRSELEGLARIFSALRTLRSSYRQFLWDGYGKNRNFRADYIKETSNGDSIM